MKRPFFTCAGAALCILALCTGCVGKTAAVPSPTPTVEAVRPSPSPAPPPADGTPEPASSVEPAVTPEPTPSETPGPEVLPGGIYTRRYAAYTDTLIPAEDYGPLIPYLGDKLGPYLDGGRWGLATLDGELVTDPVFSQVFRGAPGGNGGENLPYLLLGKPAPIYEAPGWVNGEYDFGVAYDSVWAMAATDGSWCTEFRYRVYRELTNWGLSGVGGACQCDGRGLFVRDAFDNSLVYLDGATGEELIRVGDVPVEDWDAAIAENLLIGHYSDEHNQFVGIVINLSTGKRLEAPDILFKGYGDGLLTAYDRYAYRTGYMDLDGNWVIPAVCPGAADFQNGMARVTLPDGQGDAVIDTRGSILLQAPELLARDGQFWSVTELEWDKEACRNRVRVDAVYDAETLQPMESPLVGQELTWEWLFDEWYRYWNDEMECYVSNEEYRETRPEFRRYAYDYVTGEPYTTTNFPYDADRAGDSVSFYRLDGTPSLTFPLPDKADYVTLADGLLLVNGEESGSRSFFSDNDEIPYYPPLTASRFSGLMTPEGEWIFRYPLPPTPSGTE